ncbi:MAG TPA: SLC13 family permease [Balneolaceae bacterium]|nr:SLC13 family permease [Balneolaceae bacterium]
MISSSNDASGRIHTDSIPLLRIYKDPFVIFSGLILIVLLYLKPTPASRLYSFIHWPTIAALAGLLAITTGFSQSGLMEYGAEHLIEILHTKQGLWFSLILFSAVGAMFLTNDIVLFLIIPFTLRLHSKMPLKIRPLLIIETIAVNAGSMLTPIGNPQNIYLWQKSHLSFFTFTGVMLVPVLIQIILLLTIISFIGDKGALSKKISFSQAKNYYPLALVSVMLLIGYLIANRMGSGLYAVGFILMFYLLFYRKIFLSIDWSLIVLFLFLFIDVGIVTQFSFVKTFSASLNLSNPLHVAGAGIGYSQVISNVPATLLLAHFTRQWKYLAWGVNIGANGLLISSFANFIAVRLAHSQKIGWVYHYYAIPFLVISGGLVYLWISLFGMY